MAGREGKFFLYFSKEEIKTLIAKYGTDIKEDLIKKIKADSLNQTAQTTTQSYDQEVKDWKLRKLKAETMLKERKLDYVETFGTRPSPEARRAMSELVSHHVATVPQAAPKTTFEAAQHCKVYQDRLNGYHSQCLYCEYYTFQPRDTPIAAIDDLKKHLATHNEVWK